MAKVNHASKDFLGRASRWSGIGYSGIRIGEIMGKKLRSLGLAIVLIFLVVGLAGAWPIPDTGQTKCYDNYGEIPCPQPGESFYGQDASYLINPPSFTKLDSQGNDLPESADSWVMVRDNVTGLIWEVKQNKDGVEDYSNPHDADNRYTWYDSNAEINAVGDYGDGRNTEAFIDSLNTSEYGGFNDWRLPTAYEIQSTINYNDYNHVFINYFPNSIYEPYTRYWSATFRTWQPENAFCFNYHISEILPDRKLVHHHVRAVRAGLPRLLDDL
jgi:hypothetical protein